MVNVSGMCPCRALGDVVANGAPTRSDWLKRHGDNRVPIVLAIPNNNVHVRSCPEPAAPDSALKGSQDHMLQATGPDTARTVNTSKGQSSPGIPDNAWPL